MSRTGSDSKKKLRISIVCLPAKSSDLHTHLLIDLTELIPVGILIKTFLSKEIGNCEHPQADHNDFGEMTFASFYVLLMEEKFSDSLCYLV